MVKVVYHGLPVSKRHGILPWLPCFKTPWIAMAFTMVYFHKGIVRKSVSFLSSWPSGASSHVVSLADERISSYCWSAHLWAFMRRSGFH